MDKPTISETVARVYEVASETPLERASKVSAACGNAVYLKREDMQAVHSFKIRGAYNKIRQLSETERAKGVIAASAGNHAQGVALSAQKLGMRATIVMPRTTPAIKIEAVKSYGAEVILAGDSYSDAYAHCQTLIGSSGMTFVHPFDDSDVIAGQGTVGYEILEQLPDVDYIFVPVGGGGLIAGIAEYIKNVRPEVKIIGVEPDDSNAMQASLAAGKRVTLEHVGVFADGVAVKQVGEITFELCQKYVDEVITVNNDQICAAIKHIYEATRGIVEPAGALSLAGALAYAESHHLKGKKLVTICSGANMSFEKLQFIAERTLLGSGKEALFEITLPEEPGALSRLCGKVISGHNISEFSYRLSSRARAHIFVGITIRDTGDKQRLCSRLEQEHYEFQDLSADDSTKEHVRHMIGGAARKTAAEGKEYLFEINFPERPRALAEFLASLGGAYNISLFHYRGQGGDIGKVLIGFEADSLDGLQRALKQTGYEFERVHSPGAIAFLGLDG